MKKIKKIWQLADPPPNLWYEISCYLKATVGLILFILGCFFLLSPLLKKELVILGLGIIIGPLGRAVITLEEGVFGQNFVFLSLFYGVLLISSGVWVFRKIKLVRQLFKILRS